MITREQALEIAVRRAREQAGRMQDKIRQVEFHYLRGVESPEWKPHDWVVKAIMEASTAHVEPTNTFIATTPMARAMVDAQRILALKEGGTHPGVYDSE